VAVGVAIGVAVGVGVVPAWATADQTVTASATITRDPTTERRIVAFDTAASLRPTAEGFGGAGIGVSYAGGRGMCTPALCLIL
jgi:hypothetical protein